MFAGFESQRLWSVLSGTIQGARVRSMVLLVLRLMMRNLTKGGTIGYGVVFDNDVLLWLLLLMMMWLLLLWVLLVREMLLRQRG